MPKTDAKRHRLFSMKAASESSKVTTTIIINKTFSMHTRVHTHVYTHVHVRSHTYAEAYNPVSQRAVCTFHALAAASSGAPQPQTIELSEGPGNSCHEWLPILVRSSSLCDFHHVFPELRCPACKHSFYVQRESGLLGSRFFEQGIGSQVCRMSTALPCPEVVGRMSRQPAVEQLEKGRPLEESAPRVLPALDCPLSAGIKAGSGSFKNASFLLLARLYSVFCQNQILLNNQLLQGNSMISVLLSKKWRCQCCLVMFPKEGLPALRRAGNALPPDLKLSHLHTCQQGVSVTVSLAQR